MQVDWPLILVVLLALSASAEKKKKKRTSKWAVVRGMQEDLAKLTSQVQTLSNPVQIHVHGMDNYHVDSQEKPDDKKGAFEETHGHSHEDMEQKGTQVHIHFNLPPYQESSTSHQPTVTEGNAMKEEYTYATCNMVPRHPSKKDHSFEGYIALRQKPSHPLEIHVNLQGLRMSRNRKLFKAGDKHGLHVHQYADFQNGCASFGGHFNPDGTTHGGMHDAQRHAGDWGNVLTDTQGNIRVNLTDTHSTLFGAHSIIGRGIVIHEKGDDLGKGGSKASLTTGDAGGRLNCCVIARTSGGPW